MLNRWPGGAVTCPPSTILHASLPSNRRLLMRSCRGRRARVRFRGFTFCDGLLLSHAHTKPTPKPSHLAWIRGGLSEPCKCQQDARHSSAWLPWRQHTWQLPRTMGCSGATEMIRRCRWQTGGCRCWKISPGRCEPRRKMMLLMKDVGRWNKEISERAKETSMMDGEVEFVKTEEVRDGWFSVGRAVRQGGEPEPVPLLSHIIAFGDCKKNRPFLPGPLQHESPSTWQTAALWSCWCHSGPSVTHCWPFAFTVSPLLLCLFLLHSLQIPKFGCRLPVTLHPVDLNFANYCSSTDSKTPWRKKSHTLEK